MNVYSVYSVNQNTEQWKKPQLAKRNLRYLTFKEILYKGFIFSGLNGGSKYEFSG